MNYGQHSYKGIMSHDIDFVTKFKSIRNVFGATKRQGKFFKNYLKYTEVKLNRNNDPYWSMEEMLEQNNKYGIETHFYFMAGKTDSKYDLNDYNITDPDIKELMQSLKKNKALIGLHPSYNSYNSEEIIVREKNNLEDALGEEVVMSRQHFLRYEEPLTFKLLAKAGIKQDSSVGFRKDIGLKSKANLPYTIYKDDQVELKEQPFVFMDTHLIEKGKASLKDLKLIIDNIKAEKGVAMVIWHNNNYETLEQKELYKSVLEMIKSN